MVRDDTWHAVRERCESLDPDVVLVTPETETPFVVDRTDEDGIAVSLLEGGDRTLWRDQFDVLADRVRADPLSLDSLPPGVGPYAAVLSLSPGFFVDESATELRASDESDADAPAHESPFVRSRWAVRRPPESVRDDAVLLADFLERHDAVDRTALDESALVDLYVLLSDLQWGADDLRRDVGDDLLDHLGPEGRLSGQFGTVSRVHRERRQPKDEAEIFERLDEAGVPREWVTGVDEEKLDVVLAATDVDESEVYDLTDTYHVQKTDVAGDAKRARLQGLRDRLDELRDEDADEIREEIAHLEARIDDMLAAG